MLSSIQSTLGKLAPVSTQDLTIINTLLKQGHTPSEVVAQLQSLDKFKPKAQVEKTLDLGDRMRVTYSDGSFEDIKKGSEAMSQYQQAQIAQQEREATTMTPYQRAMVEQGREKIGVSAYKAGMTEPQTNTMDYIKSKE